MSGCWQTDGRSGRKASGNIFKESMKKTNWNCRSILFLFSRLILGCVFIYACFDKILHPAEFSKAVYNYRILPDVFINLTAIMLPWLELVLGVVFILGIWMPGAVVISNLLLTMFTAALIFNLARGLDIGCGCFSTSAMESSTNIWTVLQHGSFLVPAVYLLYIIYFSRNCDALRPKT